MNGLLSMIGMQTELDTGNVDCKLKDHITLGFGDDMGCENYESNV